MPAAPEHPAGPFVAEERQPAARRNEQIDALAALPADLRVLVADLTDAQLDARYRNWTARQIVHHLVDSHVHCYARCKLALTEDVPTVKPYDETRWAELPDARTGPVAPSLALLDGLHARWVALLRTLTNDDFARGFFHPEQNKTVRLDAALAYYAWHGRHHAAQIRWLRDRHGLT